eukprot:jgi/Bigna1/80557/fgenesh1_pg.72_\
MLPRVRSPRPPRPPRPREESGGLIMLAFVASLLVMVVSARQMWKVESGFAVKRMITPRQDPEELEPASKRGKVDLPGANVFAKMMRLGGGTDMGMGELNFVDGRISECKRKILDLRSQLYQYLEELARLQTRRREILSYSPSPGGGGGGGGFPSPGISQQHTPLPPFVGGMRAPMRGLHEDEDDRSVVLESRVAKQRAAPKPRPVEGFGNVSSLYFVNDTDMMMGGCVYRGGWRKTILKINNLHLIGASPSLRARSPSPNPRLPRNRTKGEMSEFAKLVLSSNLHNLSRPSPSPGLGQYPDGDAATALGNGTQSILLNGTQASSSNDTLEDKEQAFPGLRMLDDLFQGYMDWDMPRLEETAARAATPAPGTAEAEGRNKTTRVGRPKKESLGKISLASLYALRGRLEGDVITLDDPTDGVMAEEATVESVKPWSDLGRLRNIVEREGPTGAAARAFYGGRYYVQLLEDRGIKPGQRGDEVTTIKKEAGFRPDNEIPETEAEFHKPTFKTANQWKSIYLTLTAYPRLANYFKYFGVTRAYREFRMLRRELDTLRRLVEKEDKGTADDEDLLDFYRDASGSRTPGDSVDTQSKDVYKYGCTVDLWMCVCFVACILIRWRKKTVRKRRGGDESDEDYVPPGGYIKSGSGTAEHKKEIKNSKGSRSRSRSESSAVIDEDAPAQESEHTPSLQHNDNENESACTAATPPPADDAD